MSSTTITFDVRACQHIREAIDSEANGKWRSPKNHANNTGLSIYTLQDDHPAYKLIQTSFPDKTIHTVRIHKFAPDDWVTPHTDTAYPGCDTLIVRLDDHHEPRLKIDGAYVPEAQGIGFYLPEHTVHEVTKGLTVRYTLVAWFINNTDK